MKEEPQKQGCRPEHDPETEAMIVERLGEMWARIFEGRYEREAEKEVAPPREGGARSSYGGRSNRP